MKESIKVSAYVPLGMPRLNEECLRYFSEGSRDRANVGAQLGKASVNTWRTLNLNYAHFVHDTTSCQTIPKQNLSLKCFKLGSFVESFSFVRRGTGLVVRLAIVTAGDGVQSGHGRTSPLLRLLRGHRIILRLIIPCSLRAMNTSQMTS